MSASEDLNRLRRAILLADLMQAWGIDSAKVRAAGGEDMRLAADGVRALGFEFNGVPSEETWRAVWKLLGQRKSMAARMRTARTEYEVIGKRDANV